MQLRKPQILLDRVHDLYKTEFYLLIWYDTCLVRFISISVFFFIFLHMLCHTSSIVSYAPYNFSQHRLWRIIMFITKSWHSLVVLTLELFLVDFCLFYTTTIHRMPHCDATLFKKTGTDNIKHADKIGFVFWILLQVVVWFIDERVS